VDEISETKTPKPGEWWVSGSSLIAYVVGLTLDGDPAWQQKGSRQIMSDEIKFFLACFYHEPRCDSFDWTEPAAIYPGEGYELLPVGTVLQEGDQFESISKWMNTNNAGLKKLPGWTYRRKIEPVEPDDWCEITDDEHVLRKYVDFVKSAGKYQPITQWEGRKVGHCSRWPIFCRRKNLPVQNPCTRRIDTEGRDVTKENGLHDESDRIVKRVPVRLFLDDRNNVFAVRGEWPIVVGTQIKHDADGFYIEVQP